MNVGTAVRGLSRLTPGWLVLWRLGAPEREQAGAAQVALDDVTSRSDRVRYHLGRGRRAREAGRYEQGVREARRALALNAGNPWSYALLGQCLARQSAPDLSQARHALERACALEPASGYFVRLLLEVLDAQGDVAAREDSLAWAWWNGAPVERWLPGGPRGRTLTAQSHRSVPSGRVQRTRDEAEAPARASRWHPVGAGART